MILLKKPIVRLGSKLDILLSGVPPYTFEYVSGDNKGSFVGDSYYSPVDAKVKHAVYKATDSIGDELTFTIKLMDNISILLNIIQTCLSLEDNQVVAFNQRWIEPKDQRLYVTAGILGTKVISNGQCNMNIDDDLYEVQNLALQSSYDIKYWSSSSSALNMLGRIVQSLSSNYSQQLQELFGIQIAVRPNTFNNVSSEEGSKYIYRFNLELNILYSELNINKIDYYDVFNTDLITN